MNQVFVVLGPTSSGKTSLAINLAKKYQGEIVSADSRQVYKFMDLGTGKVPLESAKKSIKEDGFWQIAGTNIWGYDLVNPDQFFSAYDYALFSLPKLKAFTHAGKPVFLTGGTGFYIDIVTKRILPSFVEPDFNLREELAKLSAEDLLAKLKDVNGQIPAKIDVKNPVRLIRAIEKSLKSKENKKELPYLKSTKYWCLGLTAPRAFLYQRTDNWAEAVWKAGLVQETKNLVDMGYGESPRLRGLVYKSVVSFLDNSMSSAEALQRIKFDLHAYVRRQQTYFNRNTDIVWFDITEENYPENIYNYVESRMKNG